MSYSNDLLELRLGWITFDVFGARHSSRFRRWAGYYFDRFRPPGLDVEDLVQEALLEAWRSVDTWDPTRGTDRFVELDRFVEFRVGRKLRVECERVLGWPDKRRGKRAVRPLSLSLAGIEEPATTAHALARVELEETLSRVPGGLRREAVTGVVLGMSLRVVAAHLYADPTKRVAYGFESREDAVRKVRCEVKQQAKIEKNRVSTRVSTIRA